MTKKEKRIKWALSFMPDDLIGKSMYCKGYNQGKFDFGMNINLNVSPKKTMNQTRKIK
jgi:hypothetical protein